MATRHLGDQSAHGNARFDHIDAQACRNLLSAIIERAIEDFNAEYIAAHRAHDAQERAERVVASAKRWLRSKDTQHFLSLLDIELAEARLLALVTDMDSGRTVYTEHAIPAKLDREAVIADYRAGDTIKKIMSRYRIGTVVLGKVLDEAGEKSRLYNPVQVGSYKFDNLNQMALSAGISRHRAKGIIKDQNEAALTALLSARRAAE